MHRPSPAVHRFYRAFYRWATLSHVQSSPRRLFACRHALHTSTRLRDESPQHDSFAAAPVQSEVTGSNSPFQLTRVRTRGLRRKHRLPQNEQQQPNDLTIPLRWRKGPVESPARRAFDTINAGDDVVRHRSSTELLIELAIPGNTIQAAQRIYGTHFEQLVRRHGARVELQDIRRKQNAKEPDTPDNLLHSVLISGTYQEVKKASDTLSTAKDFPVRTQGQATSANVPEAQRHHAPSSGPSGNTPRAFRSSRVVSVAERPRNRLLPLDLVVRERTPAFIKLDIALSQTRFEHLKAEFGLLLEILQHRHDTTIDINTFPDISAPGTEDGSVASPYVITLSGTFPSVQRSFFALQLPPLKNEPITSHKNRLTNALIVNADDKKSYFYLVAFPNLSIAQKMIANEALEIRDRTGCTLRRHVSQDCDTWLWLAGDSKDHVKQAMELLQTRTNNHAGKDTPLTILHSGYPDKHGSLSEASSSTSTVSTTQSSSAGSVTFVENAPHDQILDATEHVWNFSMQIQGQRALLVADHVVGPDIGRLLKLKEEVGCAFAFRRQREILGKGTGSSVRAMVDTLKGQVKKVASELKADVDVFIKLTPHKIRNSLTSPKSNAIIDIRGDLDPEEVVQLGEDVRVVLRGLTHPVVLITAREANVEDSVQRVPHLVQSRGITVSSFNTVTLQPQPIISFNIKTPSRTWDAIKSSEKLRVHLLHPNEQGAAVADVFTKGYERAHEGFLRLEKMGADVLTFPGKVPPRVYLKDGVLAQLRATLLLDRCVEISDHIIVVARVDSCKFTDQTGLKSAAEMGDEFLEKMSALSYAKKGYRKLGPAAKEDGRVEAKALIQRRQDKTFGNKREREPEQSTRRFADYGDPLTVAYTPSVGSTGVNNGEDRISAAKQPSRAISSAGSSFPAPDHDPIYNVLRGTRDGAQEGRSVDINKLWNEAEESLSKEAQEEEDDYDFGFDRPRYGSARDKKAATDASSPSEASGMGGPLWGPEDVVHEESARLGSDRKAHAAFNLGALKNDEDDQGDQTAYPTKVEIKDFQGSNVLGRRFYSTYPTFSNSKFVSRRLISSMTRSSQEDEVEHSNIAHIVDPNSQRTTVADYLGVPDNNMRSKVHPVRSLIALSKIARRAERRLQRSDDLSEEEIAEIQQEIRMNDRIVTRKLAWNAAGDLRLMLDRGRVNFKRAEFLEGMVEKGQALLLDDARQLKQLVQQGKVDSDQFKMTKAKIEYEYAVLVTETNRLRQFVDEDGENWRDDDDE